MSFPTRFTVRTFALLILLCFASSAWAQVDPDIEPSVLPYSVVTRNHSVTYGHSDITSGTTKTLYLQDDPAKLFCTDRKAASAKLRVCLKMGTEDFTFGLTPYHAEVQVTITAKDSFNATVVSYPACTLRIETVLSPQKIVPEQVCLKDFTANYASIDHFDVAASYISKDYTGSAYLSDSVRLVVTYDEQLEVAGTDKSDSLKVLLALMPNLGKVTGNPVTFRWQMASCNDTFPNYQFQLLRLFNIDPTKTASEEDIKATVDWSGALTIETGSKDTAIKVTIAEGTGYYLWRVRPIGNRFPGGAADDRNWGIWSCAPADGAVLTLSNPATLSRTSCSDTAIMYYEQFDDTLNWIYSRSFTEGTEGTRMGESMTYGDNLLHPVQTQTKLKSKDSLLLAQQVVDYSGRTAVASLAVPVSGTVSGTAFGYYKGVLKNSSRASGNQLYRAMDFDSDSTYNNPAKIDAGPLHTYYSDSNPDLTIPGAGGYAYARTLFTRDGTDRVREQSAPGDTFRIRNSGVDHTVKTFYSTPSDQELVAMFGDEAPIDTTVMTVISVDPNKVATVAYVTRDGQTIATCVQKGANSYQDTLKNDPTFPFQDVKHTLTKGTSYGEHGITASVRKSFTGDNNRVIRRYKITPRTINADCGTFCRTCDYVVYFFVHNIDDPGLSRRDSIIIPAGACADPLASISFADTLTLPHGTYVFERRVMTHNIDTGSITTSNPIGSRYLDEHIATVKATTSQAIDSSLERVYYFLDNAKLDSLYAYLDANYGPAVDGKYTVTTACCSVIIPVKRCDETVCSGDTIPDFERYLKDRWDSTHYSYAGGTSHHFGYDTRDFFYRKGEKLYPVLGMFVNGNGAFNAMITKMLAEPGSPYNCQKLWTCWVAIVETFAVTGTVDGSGNPDSLNTDYDLMEQFLQCAGKMYVGYSDCPYGTCARGEGYLDHAYKYFQYDSTAPSTVCEQQLGTPLLSGSYRWAPDTLHGDPNNQHWNMFYQCVMNKSRHLIHGDTLLPIECASTTPDTTCIHAVKDEAENRCRSKCEERFPSFVQSIIDAYHREGMPVEGDRDSNGVEIPIPSYKSTLPYIYCMAQALVDNCEDGCTLSIVHDSTYPTQIRRVGTDAQILAYRKSMYYPYHVSVVNDSTLDCTDPLDARIDSKPGTAKRDLLVKYLNARLQKVGARLPDLAISDSLYMCRIVQDALLTFVGKQTCLFCKGSDDDDDDGVSNATDNCPTLSNPMQEDFNHNGIGDACDRCAYWNQNDAPTMGDTGNAPDRYTSDGGAASGISAPTQLPRKLVMPRYPVEQLASGRDPSRFLPDRGAEVVAQPLSGSCPPATIPQIFRQGPDIHGEFYLADSCTLAYRRVCTFTGWAQIDTVVICTDLCSVICAPTCNSSICFRWIEPTVPDTDVVLTPITCEQNICRVLRMSVDHQVGECIQRSVDYISRRYADSCAAPQSVRDTFSIEYKLGYYHFTLYYYDRAGNLIKTVPPEGVDLSSTTRMNHPSHRFQTGYEVNSLNQVVRKKTPDGGILSYWYDDKGRVRFSQDARQATQLPQRFTYIKYDPLGRVMETGEAFVPQGATSTLAARVNLTSFPSGTKGVLERVLTYFTVPANVFYRGDTTRPQRYLRNRVSYTVRYTYNNDADDDSVATFYSYDPHGNVEWLMQRIPGLGENYIRYEYDLYSGNVTKVLYEEGFVDQFQQRYSYNRDNQLDLVETSRDSVIWDRDARYGYYAHGALRRTELGEDHIQGLDYTYTINGWLKGINHPALAWARSFDPGKDSVGNTFAADAFGMALAYYSGDFQRTYAGVSSPFNASQGTILAPGALFNGNIGSWTVNTVCPDSAIKLGGMSAERYRYDVLNRIISSSFSYYAKTIKNGYALKSGDSGSYNTAYSYDANGNLKMLFRNGFKDSAVVGSQKMDSLVYNYDAGSGRSNNLLRYVSDAMPSGNYAEDIDNQAAGNYLYDASGNLIRDVQEGLRMKWNAIGKLEQVRKRAQPGAQYPFGLDQTIKYVYDSHGDRVKKMVVDNIDSNKSTVTYYVRDANQEILAIYEQQLWVHPWTKPSCPPDNVDCDTIPNGRDNCLWTNNNNNIDGDGDGIGDVCDNAIGVANPWQEDWDQDGIPDVMDPTPADPANTGGGELVASAPLQGSKFHADTVSLTDWIAYGAKSSPRIETYKPDPAIDRSVGIAQNASALTLYSRRVREREFELKDHIENVRVVVSDLKISTSSPSGRAGFRVDSVVVQNYYAFGMPMPLRVWNGSESRFGFNGQEKSLEISASGGHNTAMFGELDTRLARRWGIDPKPNFDISAYSVFACSPIWVYDPPLDSPTVRESGYMDENVYIDSGASADPNVAGDRGTLIGGWTRVYLPIRGLILHDAGSGYDAGMYMRKNANDGHLEYVFASRGTDDILDWIANLAQGLDMSNMPRQYSIAVDNALILERYFGKNADLTYSGHSLGGGLSAAMSYATGRRAITFNAPGLSRSTKLLIDMKLAVKKGDWNLPSGNFDKVTAYVVEGEILNSTLGPIGLGADGHVRKIRVPRESKGLGDLLEWPPTAVVLHYMISVKKGLKHEGIK